MVPMTDLPKELPLLPLHGAVLMPRCMLPIPLMELPHMSMIAEAKRKNTLIGLVQPVSVPSRRRKKIKSPLFSIGCAGRVAEITQMEGEGVVALLEGVCRFDIEKEIDNHAGQRRALVNYDRYLPDLMAELSQETDRKPLLASLRRYFSTMEVDVNWPEVELASMDHLIHALTLICPFEANEKQALLESPSIQERMNLLTALCHMGSLETLNKSHHYH